MLAGRPACDNMKNSSNVSYPVIFEGFKRAFKTLLERLFLVLRWNLFSGVVPPNLPTSWIQQNFQLILETIKTARHLPRFWLEKKSCMRTLWYFPMINDHCKLQSSCLHPGRLTRNLRIHPWKRKIIWTKPSFSGSMLIFGGGSLQECIIHNLNKHQFFNPHRNPSLHTNKMVHKVQASYVKLTGVYPINTHYLVVSTPLKNMIVKLGIIFPIFGVKNKKSFKPSPR